MSNDVDFGKLAYIIANVNRANRMSLPSLRHAYATCAFDLMRWRFFSKPFPRVSTCRSDLKFHEWISCSIKRNIKCAKMCMRWEEIRISSWKIRTKKWSSRFVITWAFVRLIDRNTLHKHQIPPKQILPKNSVLFSLTKFRSKPANVNLSVCTF